MSLPDETSLLATNMNSILTKGSRGDQRKLLENVKLYVAMHQARLKQLADMEALLVHALNIDEYDIDHRWQFKVPPELLGEIFMHCVPAHGRYSPSQRQAPMVLIHVCQRWREVATGLQSLWTSLCIDMESLHRWRELVIAWFERSGLQSLSLTIKPPPGAREAGWPSGSDPKPYSLGYLNRLCPKIKRLEVDMVTTGTSLTFLKQCGFFFGLSNPNLHHLAVHALDDSDLSLDPELAPNLQILQFTRIRGGDGASDLHLRSATLRKLCISDGMRISLNSVLNILDSCPSLVHLELESLRKNNSPDSVCSRREYLKLEHLGLHLLEGICPLLKTVRLPGLTSLACGEQNWTMDDVNIFKTFLEVSQCKLTSFRGHIPWVAVEFQLDSWTSLLDTLPFVQTQELEIEELREPSGLSPSLKLVTALLPRLPHLEEVRIRATSQIEPKNSNTQWAVQRSERLDYFHLHSVLSSMRLRAFKLAIQTLDIPGLFSREPHYSDLSDRGAPLLQKKSCFLISSHAALILCFAWMRTHSAA
ncbi:hypothetical protein GGX14DRAFT_664807 [Mycena pura]|uniref:F-box domain-containing protein n=1 Tax=Mycena pura TaxID=153505 RepID=A0AAD6V6Q5_9AGAR|nr:hypothetical protein GGX14DRAFT_664807 [Mycena pura]